MKTIIYDSNTLICKITNNNRLNTMVETKKVRQLNGKVYTNIISDDIHKLNFDVLLIKNSQLSDCEDFVLWGIKGNSFSVDSVNYKFDESMPNNVADIVKKQREDYYNMNLQLIKVV